MVNEICVADTPSAEDEVERLKALVQELHEELEHVKDLADELHDELVSCEDENDRLRVRLCEALNLKEHKHRRTPYGEAEVLCTRDLETPADMAIKLTEQLLLGYTVDLEFIKRTRESLVSVGRDIWQPRDVASMVNNCMSDDVEVNASLLSMLTGRRLSALYPPVLFPVPEHNPSDFQPPQDSTYLGETPRTNDKGSGFNSITADEMQASRSTVLSPVSSKLLGTESSISMGSSQRNAIMNEGSVHSIPESLTVASVGESAPNRTRTYLSPALGGTSLSMARIPRRENTYEHLPQTIVVEHEAEHVETEHHTAHSNLMPALEESAGPEEYVSPKPQNMNMRGLKSSIVASVRKFKKLMSKKPAIEDSASSVLQPTGKAGSVLSTTKGNSSGQQGPTANIGQGDRSHSLKQCKTMRRPSPMPKPIIARKSKSFNSHGTVNPQLAPEVLMQSDSLTKSDGGYRSMGYQSMGVSPIKKVSGMRHMRRASGTQRAMLGALSATYTLAGYSKPMSPSRPISATASEPSGQQRSSAPRRPDAQTKGNERTDPSKSQTDPRRRSLSTPHLVSASSNTSQPTWNSDTLAKFSLLWSDNSVRGGGPEDRHSFNEQQELDNARHQNLDGSRQEEQGLRVVPATGQGTRRRHRLSMKADRVEMQRMIETLIRSHDEEVLRVLCRMETWQFNTFELTSASHKRPLSTLAFFLIHNMKLDKILGLDETKLARYLIAIEDGYPESNPYHNRTHAADVLRTLHMSLTRGGFWDNFVCNAEDPHAILALAERSSSESGVNKTQSKSLSVEAAARLFTMYMAAIVHDYDHQGVNNDFLIRSNDDLAILYNDVSPNENNHLAAAFSLMKKSQFSFMKPGQIPALRSLRQQVIEMVLATDMKQHFAILTAFKAKFPAAPAAYLPDTNVTVSISGSPSQRWERSDTMSSVPRSERSGHLPRVFSNLSTSEGASSHYTRDSSYHEEDGSMGRPKDSESYDEGGSVCKSRWASLPSAENGSVGKHRDSVQNSEAVYTTPKLTRLSHPEGGSVGRPARVRNAPPLGNSAVNSHRMATHRSGDKIARSHLGVGSSFMRVGVSAHEDPDHGLQDGSIRSNLSLQVEGTARPFHSSLLSKTSKSSGRQPHSAAQMSDVACPPAQFNDDETRLLCAKVLLKAADLGHLASALDVHLIWVGCLEEEMYRQGDREKVLGLPVSPLMDRQKDGVLKSQVGFFNVVAMPLYTALAQAFPGTSPLMEAAKANLDHWMKEHDSNGS